VATAAAATGLPSGVGSRPLPRAAHRGRGDAMRIGPTEIVILLLIVIGLIVVVMAFARRRSG